MESRAGQQRNQCVGRFQLTSRGSLGRQKWGLPCNWPKGVAATAKVIFLAHRNETKWPRHGTSTLRWLVLATIAVFGGCAGLTPPSDNLEGGINLDYLFGIRRPAEQSDASLIDDPEYVEYLEWKRWQDFRVYQEWKRSRDEQGKSGDAVSN